MQSLGVLEQSHRHLARRVVSVSCIHKYLSVTINIGCTYTDKIISLTIMSILRATAVDDSVCNQRDETCGAIERGLWTLIEANLGLISACLNVLKQVVYRYFLSSLGGMTRTPRARNGH